MQYLKVGMCQGVSMPRNNSGYEGLATEGILSCTGLVLTSQLDIFLAHIPPVEGCDAGRFRRNVHNMVDSALRYMLSPVSGVVISPNDMWRFGLMGDRPRSDAEAFGSWYGEFPNSGSVLVGILLEGSRYNIRLDARQGEMVRLPCNGAVQASQGTLAAHQRRTIAGGTDDKWLFRRV